MMPEGETWGNTRVVKLEYQSPHEGEEDYWQAVKNLVTGDNLEWEEEGFLEFRGPQGIRYRLTTNEVGCHATIHPVRNWTSRRPGR